jgi:2-keto-3-deoxy-L-rhamnonate aldolase RhmA
MESVMSNRVKAKLERGEVSYGTWIQLGHPGIAEVLADAKFDWIAVDCEHGVMGMDEITATLRGMHGRGPLPMARVKANEEMAIRQPLDAGVGGVFVPLVHSAAEARRAAAAAKYPPAGIRGFAYCRANGYGRNFDEYASKANDEILTIAMIESKQGVDDIDAILSVDGIDGVFIGPYDLSGSYGVVGKIDDDQVTNGCAQVVDACRRANKTAGIHVVDPTPERVRKAVADGYTLIALGMDTVFLTQGAERALEALSEALSSKSGG